MAVKIISATYNNLEGILINVEVDICKGLPQFSIVGLPDASVKVIFGDTGTVIVSHPFFNCPSNS